MTRLKCAGRGLALLTAVGLLQGGAALAQTNAATPPAPQVPGVDLLPQPATPPVDPANPGNVVETTPDVPQSPSIPPASNAPVYQPIPGLPTYTAPSKPTYSNYREIPVFVPYSARSDFDPKDKTKGENLLEAYYAPKYPATLPLHGTTGASWGPGGHVASGLRVGQPYYWSRSGYPGNPGSDYGAVYGVGNPAGYTGGVASGYTGGPTYGPPAMGTTSNVVPTAGCNCRNGSAGGMTNSGYAMPAPGGYGPAYGANHGPNSGYAGGGVGDVGASVNAAYGGGAGAFSSNPHEYHFGPGFHRHTDHAHYRFPWYSYRAPWYHPGPASYNRDTNYPW